MKRLFAPLLAMLALGAIAQAQVLPQTATVPINLQYGPLNAAGTWCTPPGSTTAYSSHQFTYMFPSGAPGAVTLTVTGSTDGRTFSSVTTGTTTTGGAISISGVYTGLCITATTMTGAGVTVQGAYAGVPLAGTATVDTTGLASSTNQTNGTQKGQICDAGGDCTTVTGSKLDVNAAIDTTGLATSTKQSDGSQKSQVVDGSGNVIGATSNALDVNVKSGTVTAAQAVAASLNATVVGTGTFATQSILTTGSAQIGHLEANQSINLVQANGTTLATGNGSVTNGSLRVVLATDQTPLTSPLLVTLSGTNNVTSNSANIATETTLAKLPLVQGADTSGQTGVLAECAVTTASPTYTTAKSNPLSCDTSGSIRVNVVSGSTGNAASSNTGAAVPTQAGYTGVNIAGNLRGVTGQNPSGVIYTMDVAGVGTAGTAAGGVLTIQGVAAMTPVLATLSGTNNIATVTTVTTVSTVSSVSAVIAGTGATNLGKAVDSAAGATDTVVAAAAIRDDALTTLTPVDGDYVNLRTNATGALWVQSSIIDAAEGAAVATNPVPMGCVYRTSFTALDVGDVGYPICDVGSRLVTVGLGTAGTAAGGVLTIQGVASMTPVLVNPGTAANWGVYVEDAGETAGGNLMMAGSVRRDTPTSSGGTTGDNATINTSADGALWVTQTPNTTGGWSSLNATAADGATACTSTVQPIKASQGTFGGYFINNPNTADSWVHIYNVASGSVTVGTTNPALTFRIPGIAANSAGANLSIPGGVQFSTAMSMACTTTAGGTGNPSAALEIDVFYK